MSSDINSLITTYRQLNEKLQFTADNDYSDGLDTPEETFVTLLRTRDTLFNLLKKSSTVSSKMLLDIKTADSELFDKGLNYILHYSINMPPLRAVAQREDEPLGWWWYLDDPEVEHGGFTALPHILRPLIWAGLAIGVLIFSLQLTINTSVRIATFIAQLFPNSEAIDLNFDTLTLLGFLAQIFIGGRVVIPVTRRVTDGINRGIYESLRFPRLRRFRHALPLSRFLIGTLLFISIIMFLDWFVLPRLGNALREQSQTAIDAHSLVRTEGSLAASALLNPDSYNAVDLALLGQRYENIGHNEDALRLYENALTADPQLLVARYWLSNAYLNQEQFIRAIEILDVGLRQVDEEIEHYRSDAAQVEGYKPTLRSLEAAIQVRYLFLINRARAFLGLGLPDGAIQDLIVARELVLNPDNQDFFIGVDNKDTPPANAIKSLDLYYYSAVTYEALFEATQDNGYLEQETEAWRTVRQLADVDNGLERLWLIEAQP